MTRNYTDKDVSMIQNIDGHVISQFDAKRILEALDKAGRITPPWEPCERDEIKKGDHYRFEYEDGAAEGVADEDFGPDLICSNERWFRIPAPVETAEWPDGESGDLYRIDYTANDGKKRDGAVAYLNVNKGGLYPVDPSLPFLFRSSLGDPQRKDVLHKVTRLKVVEA